MRKTFFSLYGENKFDSSQRVTMEMIDFQLGDKFGPELEKLISEIKDFMGESISYYSVKKHPNIKAIQDLVFKRIGLKIELELETDIPAAIMPFYSNENIIFLDEATRKYANFEDYYKDLWKKRYELNGTVDVHKVKLGGVFSEHLNKVYLNFNILFNQLNTTPAEVTAILLHELGHGFYACEYSNRLDTNNQIVAGLARYYVDNKAKRDPNYIFSELKKVDKTVTKEVAEQIANGDNLIMTRTLYNAVIKGGMGQQLTNSKYDETAFESLSDNFAARFGYDKALISGLHKLHNKFGRTEVFRIQNFNLFLLAVILSFATIIKSLLAFGVLPWNLPWIVFQIFILLFALWLGTGEANMNYTYDEAKHRYRRIRNQSVELLKTGNLSSAQTKNLLKNIEQMDDLIENTTTPRHFIDKLKNMVFSTHKDAVNSIKEQQRIEDFISNDIFVQATKMKMNAG